MGLFLELNVWTLTSAIMLLSVAYGNDMSVNTPSGTIIGTSVTVGNGTVYQYRKIPFAKPPLGNLRFRKPVPYGKWTNPLNATVFGPSCMQIFSSNLTKRFLPNLDVSEDCLQLNVYVPNNTSKYNKKSVMIWIHGGAYLFGQATSYHASYLTMTGDVIVVTINYRLGVFGFLTLDSVSKGNYGLWDQKLAIQWVHDNIESFGGNKKSVTIFGESAGSFSVGLQSINPSNQGLFQRAIEESGTAISFVSYTKNPEVFTNIFVKNLNCSEDYIATNAEKINCVRSKTADDILKADINARIHLPLRLGLGLGPVVDGDFLPDEPSKLLANQSSSHSKFFKSLDYMTGIMSSEGSLVLSFTGPQLQNIFNFDIKAGIPTRALCNEDGLAYLLTKENYDNNNKIQNAICSKYKSTKSLDEQSRQVVKFYGDSLFVAPAAQSLNLHALDNNKTSSYQFLFSRVLPSTGRKEVWFQGAQHASELAFLFGLQLYPKIVPNFVISDADLMLSKQMILYWSNFAKTGNPNGNDTTLLPHWPRYDEFQNKTSYLHLDVNVTNGFNLYEDSVKFWLQTIPRISEQTSDAVGYSINTVMALFVCVCSCLLSTVCKNYI